jgi:copper chaperone
MGLRAESGQEVALQGEGIPTPPVKNGIGGKMETLELAVEGMTCGHCVGAVQKALQGVAGVKAVRVSLPEAKAWVEGTADSRALIDAVAEEGYRARPVAQGGPS